MHFQLLCQCYSGSQGLKASLVELSEIEIFVLNAVFKKSIYMCVIVENVGKWL